MLHSDLLYVPFLESQLRFIVILDLIFKGIYLLLQVLDLFLLAIQFLGYICRSHLAASLFNFKVTDHLLHLSFLLIQGHDFAAVYINQSIQFLFVYFAKIFLLLVLSKKQFSLVVLILGFCLHQLPLQPTLALLCACLLLEERALLHLSDLLLTLYLSFSELLFELLRH
jgi:hypothetical protein